MFSTLNSYEGRRESWQLFRVLYEPPRMRLVFIAGVLSALIGSWEQEVV